MAMITKPDVGVHVDISRYFVGPAGKKSETKAVGSDRVRVGDDQ